MKTYIEERAIEIANYMIEHNATVRQAAKNFGISKSTVHKDVTERLVQVNPTLAAQARKVIDGKVENTALKEKQGKIARTLALFIPAY